MSASSLWHECDETCDMDKTELQTRGSLQCRTDFVSARQLKNIASVKLQYSYLQTVLAGARQVETKHVETGKCFDSNLQKHAMYMRNQRVVVPPLKNTRIKLNLILRNKRKSRMTLCESYQFSMREDAIKKLPAVHWANVRAALVIHDGHIPT